VETRPGTIVSVTSLVVLIVCLALSWSPWYVAGTLGYEPEIVVSYAAARSVAYWTASVLLAVGCATAFVASRHGARRRAAWRGLSLAATVGASCCVVLGLFVEPDLATRLWGTTLAPVALVTADPQALLASGVDTFFVSPGYGLWAVLATAIAGVMTAIVGLWARD
jgi:uncharacterized protein YqgC (DUF456 family)